MNQKGQMSQESTEDRGNVKIGRQSILVAVDPPSSLPDMTPVLALAIGPGWTVDLVHAVTADMRLDPEELRAIPEQISEGGFPGNDQGSETDEALATAYRELAAQAGVLGNERIHVEAHVLVGPAVDVIITAAQMLNSAMIVVAGHRRAIDSRTVLGSFTLALLKVADRPVLVLPAGETYQQPGFVASVDRLIELIDREDDETRLGELRQAAATQLQQPASHQSTRHLGDRLLDALHQFETSHPTITSAINDVSYYLSGMGI